VFFTALLSGISFYLIFPLFRSFEPLLLIVILSAFFAFPLMPLLESSVMHMLGEQRDRYGRIRLWGTVGWGLAAPFAGAVLARWGLHWMFWLFAGFMVFNIFLARDLRFEVTPQQSGMWQGIRVFVSQPHWILFFAIILMASLGFVADMNFLALLLDEMGASPGFLGLAVTVSTIFEIPVMIFSSNLLRRFSNRGLLLTAIAVVGLRCALYLLVTAPIQVLLLQMLHGFTYPICWIAAVSYVTKHSPPGLSATGQGLLDTSMNGLGTAGGNLLAGVLIGSFGIRGMYRIIAWLMFASLAVFSALNLWLNRRTLAATTK
jgi:MFS family permease